MLSVEFWTALERVGALVLLAATLWLGWKYLKEKEGKEHSRLTDLVTFIQHQVEGAQVAQALYVDKLEETHKQNSAALTDLITHMIECTMTTSQALQNLQGSTTEEHAAIIKAVESFNELRETSTDEHKAILRAIEQLKEN